jgi:hypothetical protein
MGCPGPGAADGADWALTWDLVEQTMIQYREVVGPVKLSSKPNR